MQRFCTQMTALRADGDDMRARAYSWFSRFS
jgi:hypothetical protein